MFEQPSTFSSENEGNDEYTMPCAEAILAGTLALMTGHARCGCAQQRDLMAKKAVSNLALLAQHCVMSEGFKTVALRLQEQWMALVAAERCDHFAAARAAQQFAASHDEVTRAELAKAEKYRATWHTTPETMQ